MNALITAPGFYPDITPDQYFAEPCPAPALTNSGIGTLLASCPAKFAFEHPAIGQPEEERQSTAAQYLGSLVHRLALGKGADYAVSPHDEYRSKEARAWRDDTIAAGLIPVKEKEFARASEMAAAILPRIIESMGGDDYQTEVVVAWQRDGIWCRIMVDLWSRRLLRARDLKTCADASDRSIEGAFARGYSRQQGWYTEGLGAVTGEEGKIDFGFLFVENAAPFLTRTAATSEAARFGAMQDCNRGFDIFRSCLRSGDWPGYQHKQVEPTMWQMREWADAELQEAA